MSIEQNRNIYSSSNRIAELTSSTNDNFVYDRHHSPVPPPNSFQITHNIFGRSSARYNDNIAQIANQKQKNFSENKKINKTKATATTDRWNERHSNHISTTTTTTTTFFLFLFVVYYVICIRAFGAFVYVSFTHRLACSTHKIQCDPIDITEKSKTKKEKTRGIVNVSQSRASCVSFKPITIYWIASDWLK